jgi:hydroxylaminobenzene mutase
MTNRYSHRLLQLGFLLFLFGLLTGFAIPFLANPRMGLSSHLEGVLNGVFLIGLALAWPQLRLSAGMQRFTFWVAAYGTVANWLVTLLAAVWGAGAAMMPIAGQGLNGTPIQEILIAVFLLSLSLGMVSVCVIVLWGLRGGADMEQKTSPISSHSPGAVSSLNL